MTSSADASSSVNAVAALAPLREIIQTYGLDARKALGQNFLLDLNLTGRIAREARLPPGCHVLEVGPGPGGLTRALLAAREDLTVTAVEMDRRCVAALSEYLVPAAAGRLTLVEGDALAVDAAALLPEPRAVVANLPYNVATPLLLGWLRRIEAFSCLTLMFQKEVADRIVAPPGGKAYGRLSVICQWAAEPQVVMNLPARAFTPPPKVDSAVVRFTPRAAREGADFQAMETVTAAAFGQRRKMLRQSLKSLGDAEALLAATGLPPTARAEEIPVAGFAALARAWRESPRGVPA
jgi:16S rRNA (adenine1518-N6/adenine1519-N6)-dimethyltransferase